MTTKEDSTPRPTFWEKTKGALSRWEYWAGAFSIIVTIAISVLIIVNLEFVQALEGYGYLGGFLISLIGGALVIIPVPMIPVQFALGGVLAPWIGPPILGPFWTGLVCAAGETAGAATIYLTGRGAGIPMARAQEGWRQRTYNWLTRMVHKRGGLTLFALSAIMNPFYYPISLVYGATRFGLQRYSAIAFLGKLVKCNLVAYAGYFGLRGIFNALGIPV